MMKVFRTIAIAIFALSFLSCATISETKDSEQIVKERVQQRPLEVNSVNSAIAETDNILKELEQYHKEIPRDIDNREWLMSYINYCADRDRLIVQNIYENLKYRNWSIPEKSEYINHYYLLKDDGSFAGALMELRNSVWEEISYLLKNSHLLQDSPWMVRDFYDERSELNYWYLIYLARVYYPHRIENQIMPAMLTLIPEDRINGVSYLWLKSPDSLCKMKKEIIDTGYPWNELLSLIDINNFIQKQLLMIKQIPSTDSENKKTCIF